MGMSTYVLGFRPPDEKWRLMADIWNKCEAANVTPPKEVEDFFNDEPPDTAGVLVDIDNASQDFEDDSIQGIEVDPEHGGQLEVFLP